MEAYGVWCDDTPWNDVRYLPNKVKKAVIDKLSLYNGDQTWQREFADIKKWLTTTPIDHNDLQNSFIEFNNKVDKVREEKFSDVFPEYAKLF